MPRPCHSPLFDHPNISPYKVESVDVTVGAVNDLVRSGKADASLLTRATCNHIKFDNYCCYTTDFLEISEPCGNIV